jgi:glycosyl transferase family 25
MLSPNWHCIVINLKRSAARLQTISEQLKDADIAFDRFEAVDGNRLGAEQMQQFEREGYERRHGKSAAPGEIGCFLSHIGAMRQFLMTDREYCLILEDDAIIEPALAQTLDELANVAKQWDVALLYGNHRGAPFTQSQLSVKHRLVGFFTRQTGTVAYALNRHAAQTYLRELLPMSLPIDQEFDRAWNFRIKFRGVMPFPVSTGAYPSDIGKLGTKLAWHRRVLTWALRALAETRRGFHYAAVDPIWLSALVYVLRETGSSFSEWIS